MLDLAHIQKQESRLAWPLFLAAALVIVGALYALTVIEHKYNQRLSDEFHRVLLGTQQAIHVWAAEESRVAKSIAANTEVRRAVSNLLAEPEKTQVRLIASEGVQKLRSFFEPALKNSVFRGFFIIDSNNLNLASSRDHNIGTESLLVTQPDMLARAWAGETVVTRVQTSDVALGSGTSTLGTNSITMFVLTPVTDHQGVFTALLALRIDPENVFFPILNRQRLGQTGETYAFDKNGLMLSDSRFHDLLRRRGIITGLQRTAGLLKLWTPSSVSAAQDSTPPKLTLMAQYATQGRAGENYEGYEDYAGQNVVGAWLWDEALGLGLATEQNEEESHALLGSIEAAIIISAVFTAGLLVVIAFISLNSKRRIRQASHILQSVVGTAGDGIVLIDRAGVILSVNPAMEKLFGYEANEMVGQKVQMLMPSGENKQHHDGYISRYVSTGEKRIIGTGTEAEGMRKDGSRIQLLLTVSELKLEEGVFFSGFLKDITALKTAQNALQDASDELALMALVAEKTDNAVIVTNPEGEILWCNPGFTKITGYELDEVAGRKPGDFLQGAGTNPDAVKQVREAVRDGRRVETELLNYSKSGAPYWINIEVVPVFDESGNVHRFIALERDVTEEKEVRLALENAKDQAEEASKAKSTFLATMSHEIRTPLNGIVATMDLLQYQTALTDEQRELVTTACSSSNTLTQIIDDILDFSKIEAGRIELERKPLRLMNLLERVGDSLGYLAEQKKVGLLLFCEPGLAQVEADCIRLQQILLNLVGNAIKFSSGVSGRQGQVCVTIEQSGPVVDARVPIVFRVRDNGIGMNPEVQTRLFQPFIQGEDNTTRRFGGTGLGLVITQRLVSLMDGDIEVDSEENVGTTFTVALPLVTHPSLADQSGVAGDLKGVKVLVHGGDNDLEMIVSRYVDALNVDCRFSDRDGDSDAFVETLSLDPAKGIEGIGIVIDCVGDIQFRQALAKKVCGTPAETRLRFLLLQKGWGRFVRQSTGDALELDVNNMKFNAFANAIAALAGVESPDQESLQNETSPSNQVYDVTTDMGSDYKILLVDDNATNQKVMGHQLKVLGYSADVAGDGAQALAMWREHHYPLILTDCHMPVMDGYQLATAIRKEQGDRSVAIVAVTAEALKGTADKCIRAGMDSYVTKPVQLEQLRLCIEQVLPLVIEEKPRTDDESAPVENEIDSGALAQLLGSDDPAILEKFYYDFVDKGQKIAFELAQVAEQGDFRAVRQVAHKLKSSARMVGANTLADACSNLERAGKAEDLATIERVVPVMQEKFSAFEQWLSERSTEEA